MILTVVIVTSLAILIPLFFLSPKFESTAQILQRHTGLEKVILGTNIFPNADAEPERDIQTAAELVDSPAVVKAVTEQLGDRLFGKQADKMITVKVVNKVDLLEITATDTDPNLAADVANSFASEYILWRQTLDQKAVSRARAPIEQEVKSLPESQHDSDSYKLLIEKIQSLKLAEAMQVGNLQIAKRAAPALIPVSPKPLRNGLIAFFTSILFGVGIALLRNSLETKIISVSDITKEIDRPILVSIPTETWSNGNLVTISHPNSACAEAYRLLKNNLSFISPDSETRILMITSPGPEEGKSTTVANLAVTIARGGQSVMVLEFDFRRPSLSRLLGLTEEIGVTNVIAGTHSMMDVIQVIPARDLEVARAAPSSETIHKNDSLYCSKNVSCIVCGPIPPNPGELVASKKVAYIISRVAKSFDYVLIDTPPIGLVGDASSLAMKVDGMLLVVRMGQTDKKTLGATKDIMRNMPTNLLGVVITDVDAGASGYAYGYAADRNYYE